MTIGERIAQLLKLQGKMAKDLAEYLGISASSVTGWVHGSYPSSQYVVKISEFFGISANYLLTGQDASEQSGTSAEGLRVAQLWDKLDERGQTIVLAKIYERLELAERRKEDADPAEGPILKQA